MKRIVVWLGVLLMMAELGWAMAGAPSDADRDDQQLQAYQRIGLGAAAAFAVGIGIIGSGYAVAKIGSAALGAAAEKPELLMRSLLFVALAEGLAVLGFAVAMILIQKI